MNLSEIKSSLNKETLNFNYVVTADGVKTSWLKDWNNSERIAILIHADTLAKIKADTTVSSLGINTQTKQGAKGEYTSKVICMYTPADETL